MPAVQTTYANTLAAGLPGQIANEAGPPIVISRVLQSPAVTMAFGAVAMRGTLYNGCLNAGDAGAGTFRGIAVIDGGVRPMANGTVDVYQTGDIVGILEKGYIWVAVGVAVTQGTQAYYTPAGAITNVSTANTAIPGGFFDTSTAGAGVARLKLG